MYSIEYLCPLGKCDHAVLNIRQTYKVHMLFNVTKGSKKGEFDSMRYTVNIDGRIFQLSSMVI
jgi:hypothetical protein